jgi:anti-anti-sigma factor
VNGDFTIELVERRDTAAVFELGGEVDMANAEDAHSRILEALGRESSVVLDLDNLRYLDSAGVRLFFDLSEELARDGRLLVLVVTSGAPVRKVLSITKLDLLVRVHDDVAGALEAAGAT